jgi:GntR family transcriptional repressor for pyruvate dehydrogenase complex
VVLYDPFVAEPPARNQNGTRPPALGRGEKVASRVARQIVRDIVDRDLVPGDALEPESAMLDRFGISRASLREALRILETQGLISIKPGPGGGPSLSDIDSRDFGRMATLFFQVLRVDLGAVVEARLIIEPVMARLAAKRRDAEVTEVFERVIRDHHEADNDAAWLATTREFHALVCTMSGNALLDLLAAALKDIYTDRVAGFVFPEENRDHVVQVHGDIGRAIIAADAETAQRLMHDHMEVLAKFFEERYPGLMDEIVAWQ